MIKKIQTNDKNRIETGPLQVNDDWPGIFIRGDNAFYYALALRHILDSSKDLNDKDVNPFSRYSVEELVELLQSCIVKNEDEECSTSLTESENSTNN